MQDVEETRRRSGDLGDSLDTQARKSSETQGQEVLDHMLEVVLVSVLHSSFLGGVGQAWIQEEAKDYCWYAEASCCGSEIRLEAPETSTTDQQFRLDNTLFLGRRVQHVPDTAKRQPVS